MNHYMRIVSQDGGGESGVDESPDVKALLFPSQSGQAFLTVDVSLEKKEGLAHRSGFARHTGRRRLFNQHTRVSDVVV